MNKAFPISNLQSPITPARLEPVASRRRQIGDRQWTIENAFSLLEVLVVVALLSLIVVALMSVFSGTQRAFRASITQTDVLEGGRTAVDLMASDLRMMTPSGGVSNGPVNFAVFASGYPPMLQGLTASPKGMERTNLLNTFFALGRENTKWTAVGYVVNAASTNSLYPLYRFYAETNLSASPFWLYDKFNNDINNGWWTNMNHVIDGVVHLTLRAYDPNGIWIQNAVVPVYTNAPNVEFLYPPNWALSYGEAQLRMFSNTVPASVDMELGVLEDQALARAESLPTYTLQTNYLAGQIGALHVFRQRVNIPNVDLSAYP